MTMEECEEAFRKNNLELLAQQYNINLADADIMQAKIWDLPEVTFQANAYNPEGKRFFDIGKSKNATIQQLIYLGGKKKNEIEFAKSNKELAQLQFSQLLADLRSQMRETYYALYFEEKKLQSVDIQLKYMNDLLEAYRVQTQKGNTSLKDEVRLQAVVINLNNDKVEINNNILQQQQSMKVLTGLNESMLTNFGDEEANKLMAVEPLMTIDDIKQKALENNADYLFSVKTIDNNKTYLKWQKSLNVPDINVGGAWSQNGGTFNNEIDFTIGIPIPLWKRNKGNVVKAQYQIEQSQKTVEMKKQQLETQLDMAYQTWQNQYQQYFTLKPQDMDNLETVYQGILKNFRKGNISLIEFTDFTDSYRQTILQLYEMKKQIMISAEEINHLTQSKIFY
ncbi:transporter [Elizabethkingia meningoseptica]|uniref:Transporter n=2 Tax=Weeksellaceae TaxID=2762318 RepID=A0A1V3U1K3_ELIME|nr:transporter [Elizabethkingia meningoseptica]MBG0514951.1 TolC family protein [Elizabethkingia meningoseptica]MDE5429393.1 TolC family protein [Elizabethkingia meningoseptica]MDE5434550.1 TolC family protein [Elizabethkingia meningoseptica]MDE5449209.1 TolC family protein [Elizabethkingia meningoseptica]